MLLAADIGATKSVLALVDPASPARPLAEATLVSASYPDLAALLEAFLERLPAPQARAVERASLGLAGVVSGTRAQVTNLRWPEIDALDLAARFGLGAVRLLNDLEAIAYAVPRLEPGDLHTLYAGEAAPGGAIAVVAPGTGLGEAFLLWDGGAYRPFPSEGGNVDFAPADELQVELLRFLWANHSQVSYELVCSGLGLPNLYAFLRASGRYEEPGWLAAAIATAPDATPLIVGAALDPVRGCELCRATLALFVDILGAEAGNLALKVLATGGIYLGGGIPPRILPALESPRFLAALRRKGPFAELLARVPVQVIGNPRAALLGAIYALDS
jgi:glucokinase